MTDSILYFDHFTRQPPSLKVKKCVQHVINTFWASPWAPYSLGQEAARALLDSFTLCEKLLQVGTKKLSITHSGQEAVSLLLQSLHKEEENPHIVIASTERLSTLRVLQEYSFGKVFPSLHGYIEEDALEKALTPATRLVLLPLIDVYTGVVQPLDGITALLRKKSIRLAIYVSHPISQMPDGDDIIFDASTLGSPLGLGALISSRSSLPYQSETQAPDTVLRCHTLATLLEESLSKIQAQTEIARLKEMFESSLKKAIPELLIPNSDEVRVPFLSTLLFPFVKGESLLFLLQRKNLFASLGGGDIQVLSRQFLERGFSPEYAQGALSFSFSEETKEEDILSGIRRIHEAYKHIRSMYE